MVVATLVSLLLLSGLLLGGSLLFFATLWGVGVILSDLRFEVTVVCSNDNGKYFCWFCVAGAMKSLMNLGV